jgi:hypothetical protein
LPYADILPLSGHLASRKNTSTLIDVRYILVGKKFTGKQSKNRNWGLILGKNKIAIRKSVRKIF